MPSNVNPSATVGIEIRLSGCSVNNPVIPEKMRATLLLSIKKSTIILVNGEKRDWTATGAQ